MKGTTVDAANEGYDTQVLTAATAAVNMEPEDGQRALDEMSEAGAKTV